MAGESNFDWLDFYQIIDFDWLKFQSWFQGHEVKDQECVPCSKISPRIPREITKAIDGHSA